MKKITKLLRPLAFLLAFIVVAMVIRRVLVLRGVLTSFTPGGGKPFDLGFSLHPVITLLHILPGAVFMILGPMQFLPNLRKKYPAFSRRSGRVFLLSGFIIGVTALVMPFVLLPIGGVNEAAAVLFFGTYFLVALGKAWAADPSRSGKSREWMIRAFAMGLAVATTRLIVALFFVFSRLSPHEFFGTAFWIGFTLHAFAAEIWINSTRTLLPLAE